MYFILSSPLRPLKRVNYVTVANSHKNMNENWIKMECDPYRGQKYFLKCALDLDYEVNRICCDSN